MKYIVGITGQTGSGKTYTADYLAKELGIRVIHLDEYVLKTLASKPLIKWAAELKIGHEIEPDATNPNFQNFDGKTSNMVLWALMYFSNATLKRILKENSDDPLIVEYFALPNLKEAKNFDKNVYIEGDETLRVQKLMQRGNLTQQAVQNKEVLTKAVDFSRLAYDNILFNEYNGISAKMKDIAMSVKEDISKRRENYNAPNKNF